MGRVLRERIGQRGTDVQLLVRENKFEYCMLELVANQVQLQNYKA